MTMIFCPGCNHKMLSYELSCPICGFTDSYSIGSGGFLDGIEEEFGYDEDTFCEDDF